MTGHDQGPAVFASALPVVHQIVAFIARKHRLHRDEAEELAAAAHLRLIENQYAVFRKFEGRSNLRTYLTVVIERILLDLRISAHGRWRPSAAARRAGPAAIRFERLRARGLSFDDAVADLRRQPGLPVDAAALQALPRRTSVLRRRFVGERSLDDLASTNHDPAGSLLRRERQALAWHAARALRTQLAALPPDDQHIVRLRFFEGLSVADIARRQTGDPKALYRRMDRALKRLRHGLETAGLRRADVLDAVGASDAM